MKVIVLDNNCLLQILPKSAPKRWLFDYILQGRVSLAVSTDILFEYEEMIGKILEPQVGSNLVKLFMRLSATQLVEPKYFWNLITDDDDDNKYVDCAVAVNADFLISNDRHFKVLDEIPFPKIVRLPLNQVKQSMFK